MTEPATSHENPDNPVVLQPRTQALAVLHVLRDGQVLDLLTLEMQRAMLALNASDNPKAKAKVVLEISFERHHKIAGGVVTEADIKSKLPKQGIPADMLFTDEDGNLLTRHPNQRDMFERPQRV